MLETRSAVNVLLVTWLLVIWSGVVFDIDHFPLTNTPMYATWERKEVLTHVVTDRATLMQGIAVTRRDGTSDLIQRDDLNLPLRQYYKLYYQKVHNREPFLLFQAFNRTLGLDPDDPDFIVGITVPMELMHRRVDDISQLERETRVTRLEWDEAWRERW